MNTGVLPKQSLSKHFKSEVLVGHYDERAYDHKVIWSLTGERVCGNDGIERYFILKRAIKLSKASNNSGVSICRTHVFCRVSYAGVIA
jgi:hypothetical protein